jgi:hypothetical protein
MAWSSQKDIQADRLGLDQVEGPFCRYDVAHDLAEFGAAPSLFDEVGGEHWPAKTVNLLDRLIVNRQFLQITWL